MEFSTTFREDLRGSKCNLSGSSGPCGGCRRSKHLYVLARLKEILAVLLKVLRFL